jgi:FtsX-like permease family
VLGSFTVRRARSAWLLVGCLTATVLVASALVSALVTFYTSALTGAVSNELVQAGPAMSIAVSGELTGTPAAQAAGIASRVTRALGPVPYQLYQATWSDALAVPGPARVGQVPVMQAAAMAGITAHAALTGGRWPSAPRPGQPVPAALPATAAAGLGLRIGSVFSLRDLNSGSQVTLQVSGLYRAVRPAGAYWQIDLIGPSGLTIGGGFASYGPAVVSPAVFAQAGTHAPLIAPTQTSFVVQPRIASITPAELTPLSGRVAAMVSAIDDAGQLTGTTAMPQTLANAAAGEAAAKTLVVISGLQLLLLACAALALASRLLAGNRDWETALLAARGAARRQLIVPSLAEAAVAVAVSGAAGVVAGSWLSTALLDHLTGRSSHVTMPGVTVWVAGAGLVVLCVGIVIWPAARPSRPAQVRIRRGRSAPLATAVAAGADIALVVLAILAIRELRSYSVADQVASGTGIDPVIAVAPMLALAGLAVVPLRLLPIAARGLERLSARGRRLGSAMANWEISRRPLRQSGPALLVILTVGASTMALAQYQSWRASERDQAEFAAGAQVRVEPVLPEPMTDVTRITRLPGVTAAMPVSEQPLLGSGQLLVLDASLAPRTVTLRPDLASEPVTQLFQAITARARPGVLLPGRPVRFEVTASMTGPPGWAALGPVPVTLTLQDADGVGYSVVTSAMPADGRTHQLVAVLGASAGAAYPLRLIGASVSYQMPAYPQTARAYVADESAVLRLDSLSVSATSTGPFELPFASGAALATWPVTSADPGLAGEIAVLGGGTDGAQVPAVSTSGPAGGAEVVSFDPGYGPLLPGTSPTSPGEADLDLDILSTRPVPVIATLGYASAGGLHSGSVFSVTIAGQDVPCRLVATVSAFPDDGALVADQTAVQDALASKGFGGTLPVTSWWLTTANGAVPRGLPADSVVTDAAALDRRLVRDPLSAAPVQAAAAVAAAAAVLAALGFCVSVVASARERRPQRALLGALGVPPATQAGLFCAEEALISLPAAVIGLAIGTLLAHLVVPALTVTATGGLPPLPVLVTLPAGWTILIAAGLPAVPVFAAAFVAVRRPDPAAELRAAEAAA